MAGSPFAYVAYHHVSPQAYGLLFALSVAGIMAVNVVNARLVVRLGSDRLVRLGTLGVETAGLVVAVTASTGWGGLAGLVLPFLAYAAENDSSSPTPSPGRSPGVRDGLGRCRRWSVRRSTAPASHAPRWSTPSLMGRPGQYAG